MCTGTSCTTPTKSQNYPVYKKDTNMAELLTVLLGDKLLTKDGEKDTLDVLADKKAMCLYFSAHWCPPCRGFTPKLAGVYNGSESSGCAIVFVSSDRTESDFTEYFGEMPWHALPFNKRKEKASLANLCGVSGIPMLVVFKIEGNKAKLVDKNGRGHVSSKPNLDFDCLK